MPRLNINPQSVLLTSGQAATFDATDDAGNQVSVSWTPPSTGTFAPLAVNTQVEVPSATYIAPTLVPSAQTIAVIASKGNDSASATVFLTPDAVSVVPAKVDLKPNQMQQFVAIVAGAHAGTAPIPAPASAPPPPVPPFSNVTWILSPPLGSLDQQGMYTAPSEIPDTTTVNVIAASQASGRQGVAVVSLSSPPWTGRGVQLLGAYLLLVFTLVFLMLLLWPETLSGADTARRERIEAEGVLNGKASELKAAKDNLTEAQARKAEASDHAHEKASAVEADSNKPTGPVGTPRRSAASENAETPDEIRADKQVESASAEETRASEEWNKAKEIVDKKRAEEEKRNGTVVPTRLVGDISRELDLLWLVLLAGSLGAFLHMAQSFVDFVGNRNIKSSWAWWYYLRPFIGAGLALLFYVALRAGFLNVSGALNATTTSVTRAADVNVFGLVAVSGLVGMFSKVATQKLGDLFDTLFKSTKADETKDKLARAPKPVNQTTGAGAPDAEVPKATD